MGIKKETNPNSISLYFPPKKQTKHQNKSFSIFFWYNTQIKAFSNIFKKSFFQNLGPTIPPSFLTQNTIVPLLPLPCIPFVSENLEPPNFCDSNGVHHNFLLYVLYFSK